MPFLTTLAVLTLSSLFLGALLRKLRLPPLIGMLLLGILFGPYVLNLLSPTLLDISAELRKLALLVILFRAGLSLDLADLRKVGRPAILLCFVPACFEIAGYVLWSWLLLGLSPAEGALMGAVMAAVSPAVVVPRMLRLQKEGLGTDKGIPQMITAGASCDDVFVIVLFTAFLAMNGTGQFDPLLLLHVPASVLSGVLTGAALGMIFALLLVRFPMRETGVLLCLLSVAFLLLALEDALPAFLPFSGLLAVLALGVALRRGDIGRAERLTGRFGELWVPAEIGLFVLVGAQVDLSYALFAGGRLLPVLLLSLLLRMTGVFVCLLHTPLSFRERLFCSIAYLPKATVQAAIGGLALSAGLPCGGQVLTCAVLGILLTAPLGALAIDLSGHALLHRAEQETA